MLTRRHVLPPSLLGRMARHRLVQNARSRPNSKTASLYPECNQICAVHARSAYSTDSTPIFMSIGGLQAHVNSKPSMSAIAYRLVYIRGCQEHSSPFAGGAVFVRDIQSL